jgi:acetyl esterase/lipase
MRKDVAFLLFFIFSGNLIYAQLPSYIKDILPERTITHLDLAYANDTLVKHTLDVYIPPHAGKTVPLLIWIHGGGWTAGNKYGDMQNMQTALKGILDSGFAVASIDYRYSTTAIFPAQIQDCNEAINYLYKNAKKYQLDRHKFGVIGFSAGGHLASLLATSNNKKVKGFYSNKKRPCFKIKAAIDFYGPSDFIARIGSMQLEEGDRKSTSTNLLGVQPLIRPDLAKFASPTTYIDKNDPPFLIFHGDKDPQVPITLSKLLESYLKLANVQSELVIVKGAPHGGELFGSEDIKNKILAFLNLYLK